MGGLEKRLGIHPDVPGQNAGDVPEGEAFLEGYPGAEFAAPQQGAERVVVGQPPDQQVSAGLQFPVLVQKPENPGIQTGMVQQVALVQALQDGIQRFPPVHFKNHPFVEHRRHHQIVPAEVPEGQDSQNQ